MKKRANDYNGHNHQEETTQIRVLVLDYPKPIREGIYDMAVTSIYAGWEPDEGDMLMVGLTVLERKDFIPHFIVAIPFNNHGNNYYMYCFLSTILGRKVNNGDFNDLLSLLGRRVKAHVRYGENGKRIISVTPRWWDGEIPEYARWMEYVPPDDIEYGW